MNFMDFMNRPFLVYAFLQEELVYSTAHSPELRSDALFVDSSHTHHEQELLHQSSRLGTNPNKDCMVL